jgi:hypothetical protein
VAPSGPDWDAVIADLARHLAVASGLFWTKLRNTYDGLARRDSSENHALVNALLARRGAE